MLEKIRAGLAGVEAGQDLSHEEAAARLAKWRDGRYQRPDRPTLAET